MSERKYIPQPIDTNDVTLPKELEELVEKMSKNVHEVWAETRVKQGWTYGEQRNDELKTHPCLIPYEDLPEAEKEYDRKKQPLTEREDAIRKFCHDCATVIYSHSKQYP